MDTTSTKHKLKQQKQQHLKHLKHYTPLLSLTRSTNSNPFSILVIWVTKSLKTLCFRLHFSHGFCLKKIQYHGIVYGSTTMEGLSLADKNEENGVGKRETFCDLIEEKGCESSSSSEFLSSENVGNEEHSISSSTEVDSSSSPSLGWNVKEISESDCISVHDSEDGKKKHLVEKEFVKQVSALSGINFNLCLCKKSLLFFFFFNF